MKPLIDLPKAEDTSEDYKTRFVIIVECKDEQNQIDVLRLLLDKGEECKAFIL